MSILNVKAAMLLLLALIVLSVIRTLLIRSKLIESKIDIDDLLLGDDGKLSKAAAVMLGSFLFTTWLMGYLLLDGKMTEGYFQAYLLAWVAPAVTAIITRKAPVAA